jgi:hypothetical protein
VDELAFGSIGLGARTIFSWTSGILGAVISAFAFAAAGTVDAITSGIERGNKWLTVDRKTLSLYI